MVGPRFSVVRDDAGGLSVLSITGELDAVTVPQFEQALLVALCDRDVVIDLGGLTFMDSGALAALVRGHRKAASLGLRLHLTDLPPLVARLLQTTDVARIFPTYPSVHEALRVLAAQHGGSGLVPGQLRRSDPEAEPDAEPDADADAAAATP